MRVEWLCGVVLTLAVPDSFGSEGITDTATFRERIAVPPEAVFEATLEDVSLADAPAETLGQVRITSPGNPPIRFQIPYDHSRVDPTHSYSVRGRIVLDGRFWVQLREPHRRHCASTSSAQSTSGL